jgi:hypothetical protein
MSFSEWAEPAPLPWVRWRLARVLVAAMCVQLAAVGVLLAVNAVEPADAEELLAVVAVPLYPLLGSVVTFYFATRRFGRSDQVDRPYAPAAEPYWYDDGDGDAYTGDDTWLLDPAPERENTPELTGPALGPADAERICALAKWALGTATIALVAFTMWTLCSSRARPPKTWSKL